MHDALCSDCRFTIHYLDSVLWGFKQKELIHKPIEGLLQKIENNENPDDPRSLILKISRRDRYSEYLKNEFQILRKCKEQPNNSKNFNKFFEDVLAISPTVKRKKIANWASNLDAIDEDKMFDNSIDRAVSVLFPIGSRKYCRRQIAYTITLILFIINTLLNSHLLYGFVVLSANSTLHTSVQICHHRFDSDKYQKLFSAYDSYVDVIKTNVIPFIIMSFCNLIIIIRVCRSNSSINLNNGKYHSRTTKSKRKYEKDRQLTLMLLGSSIAFLVLTLPTEINDIIRSNSGEKVVNEKTYLLSAILLSLAHLNYAIHFYIYTLTGEVFRQQLIKLWPINIIWPYIIRLLRCKQDDSSSTNQINNYRTRQFENNLNTDFDLS
ncbi:unnamed protein product [Rotaria sp. Silwood1]|nr:unnamed protein product [Rotaria sp. Silwood1]